MAIILTKGADATVRVNLKDAKTGELYDLSGFSGATAYFDAADADDPIAVTGGVDGSEDTGRLIFSISDTETDAMEAVTDGNMEVVLDQGTKRSIIQFEGKLTFKERLFSQT